MSSMTNADHGRADRRREPKADVPGAAGDPGRAGRDRQGVRGGRRRRHPRAHPRRRRAPDPGPGRLRDTVAALRERPTSSSSCPRAARSPTRTSDRLRGARRRAGHRARCTMGTVNFGDDVFLNRWAFIVELLPRMQERGDRPGVRDVRPGPASTALHRLLDKYGAAVRRPRPLDLVMGVPGGMPGTAAALVAARGDARPARGRDVLGHRHRPHHAAGACSPRWRPVATCGSAWRTRSPTPRASR